MEPVKQELSIMATHTGHHIARQDAPVDPKRPVLYSSFNSWRHTILPKFDA